MHQTSNPNIDIIHIHLFVPSQFKQCISRMFVKITMAMLMGAFFNKFTGMEVKYKIAIYMLKLIIILVLKFKVNIHF